MKKFLKPGRVVIMLTGRYAGKKAVILKVYYEGSRFRKFGHVLLAGISRAPRKISNKMSDNRKDRRIRVKPFVKYVNFNHFMPTRYTVQKQLEFNSIVTSFDKHSLLSKKSKVNDKKDQKKKDPLMNIDFKEELRRKVKNILQEKYKKLDLNDKSSENMTLKFLFKPLRF